MNGVIRTQSSHPPRQWQIAAALSAQESALGVALQSHIIARTNHNPVKVGKTLGKVLLLSLADPGLVLWVPNSDKQSNTRKVAPTSSIGWGGAARGVLNWHASALFEVEIYGQTRIKLASIPVKPQSVPVSTDINV